MAVRTGFDRRHIQVLSLCHNIHNVHLRLSLEGVKACGGRRCSICLGTVRRSGNLSPCTRDISKKTADTLNGELFVKGKVGLPSLRLVTNIFQLKLHKADERSCFLRVTGYSYFL